MSRIELLHRLRGQIQYLQQRHQEVEQRIEQGDDGQLYDRGILSVTSGTIEALAVFVDDIEREGVTA